MMHKQIQNSDPGYLKIKLEGSSIWLTFRYSTTCMFSRNINRDNITQISISVDPNDRKLIVHDYVSDRNRLFQQAWYRFFIIEDKHIAPIIENIPLESIQYCPWNDPAAEQQLDKSLAGLVDLRITHIKKGADYYIICIRSKW